MMHLVHCTWMSQLHSHHASTSMLNTLPPFPRKHCWLTLPLHLYPHCLEPPVNICDQDALYVLEGLIPCLLSLAQCIVCLDTNFQLKQKFNHDMQKGREAQRSLRDPQCLFLHTIILEQAFVEHWQDITEKVHLSWTMTLPAYSDAFPCPLLPNSNIFTCTPTCYQNNACCGN